MRWIGTASPYVRFGSWREKTMYFDRKTSMPPASPVTSKADASDRNAICLI